MNEVNLLALVDAIDICPPTEISLEFLRGMVNRMT
jgi:hypothetical protein